MTRRARRRPGARGARMFFFVDDKGPAVRGSPTGERLAQIFRKSGMLLMGCEQCCHQRSIVDRLIEGIPIGCFPDLYQALPGAEIDQVIAL
jgi:hypothetical protein